MLTRKIQKIKESYQVVIPRQFADMIGLSPGTMMGIEYENNRIVMTPVIANQSTTGASQE